MSQCAMRRATPCGHGQHGLSIDQVLWRSNASACAHAAHLREGAGLTHTRRQGHDRQHGTRGQTAQEPVEDRGLWHGRSAHTPDTLRLDARRRWRRGTRVALDTGRFSVRLRPPVRHGSRVRASGAHVGQCRVSMGCWYCRGGSAPLGLGERCGGHDRRQTIPPT